MVSITRPSSSTSSANEVLKKRKREEIYGDKENSHRNTTTPSWKQQHSNHWDSHHSSESDVKHTLTEKASRRSLNSPKGPIQKRRRSFSSLPALTTTSLPNTPTLNSYSPSFRSADANFGPNRCHICGRPRGYALRINECPVCEKGMCQVCTRTCIVCNQERCSQCCVEEGEEGDSVCLMCLNEQKQMLSDISGRNSPEGIEMNENGH